MTAIDPKTEITLRANVQGNTLEKIKIPDPVQITEADAAVIGQWAQPFSTICAIEDEIMVTDIRPTRMIEAIGILSKRLQKIIRPMAEAGARHGFGLKLMREIASEPYQLSINRRVIDAPQLTLPYRSVSRFLMTMGGVEPDLEGEIHITHFAKKLEKYKEECIDNAVEHYRQYAKTIVDYGLANGADHVIWKVERRSA